ncbi:MAG TPA: universal stress protein [Allosphingosinicella sp.]|uniref:universal stress protein n=1 Tax=Allosphingosinicella sp. TaxID=2823234 RepID=UPI002ED8F801
MKRILLATDLSEQCKFAHERAVALATSQGAELRILHAHAADASETELMVITRIIENRTRDCSARHEHCEPDLTIQLSEAPKEEAIKNEIFDFNPDVVILGSHGEPRMRDAIFGTTATHLLRSTRCPILVVQNPVEGAYSKALLAVDDAGSARRLYPFAAEMDVKDEIYAVHACEPSLRELVDGDDTEAEALAELKLAISELAREQPESPQPELFAYASQGDPMDVLQKCSREVSPDLIIMGSHGRSGFARYLLGSYSDDMLLWCPADLLVVRVDVEEAAAAA